MSTYINSSSNSSSTYINIPVETTYLSDAISELPKDCLFDKGLVGCGGTTIAIRSKENYVIVVPFVSLIENKISQHDNILGVYEGVSNKKIIEYSKKNDVKKYMVTYNSLPRLMELINPKEYRLLVDEYHILFTQYSFRKEAASSVLNNYKSFKDYCFMTATVLEQEFILKELKDIPLVIAVWQKSKEVVVESVKCDDVMKVASNTIQKYLVNRISGNAYFFVNSIEIMKRLIERNKLTENNTRVIYSKNNKKQIMINNSEVSGEPNKINFLTSTVFEGADIYDENGKIYIISDSGKSHTLIDISTSFKQIGGRIRNSKFSNKIVHLYKSTRYSNAVTYEEYKEESEKNIKATNELIEKYNSADPILKRGIVKLSCDNYVRKTDNILTFDPNQVKIDLYNFKITRCPYSMKIALNDEYISNGYKVNEHVDKSKDKVPQEVRGCESFKEAVKYIKESGLYVMEATCSGYKYSPDCDEHVKENVADYLKKYPYLEEAIEKIGYDEIEKCNYNITNIKRKTINKLDISTTSKVAKHLKVKGLVVGDFISQEKVVTLIKDAYESAGSNRNVKSTDINIFYNTKKSEKCFNGIRTTGYTILSLKVIFDEAL